MAPLIDARTIGFEAATRAVAAAVEHATGLGIAVCVAVLDRGCNLLAYVRMDGAPLVSAPLAQDKAWTAAAFCQPTDEVWEQIKDEPALVHGLPKLDRIVAMYFFVRVIFVGCGFALGGGLFGSVAGF